MTVTTQTQSHPITRSGHVVIGVDTHKYAYAPKGTSRLLHRTPGHRRPQYFASADWPGYTMLNATLQSTRSGGPIAGAWATVQAIGDDGYLDLTRRALDATDRIASGIEAVAELRFDGHRDLAKILEFVHQIPEVDVLLTLAGDPDDVRGVAAAGSLRVVGVERPSLDRGEQILDEPRFVEGVAVDRYLHVEVVGHRQVREHDRMTPTHPPATPPAVVALDQPHLHLRMGVTDGHFRLRQFVWMRAEHHRTVRAGQAETQQGVVHGAEVLVRERGEPSQQDDRALIVRPDDHVPVDITELLDRAAHDAMRNYPEWVVGYWAAVALGAAAVGSAVGGTILMLPQPAAFGEVAAGPLAQATAVSSQATPVMELETVHRLI